MFRPVLGYVIILLVSSFFFSTAHAETILLETGEKIRGRIIALDQLRVMINVNGTPKTYFFGEIRSIDGKKIEIAGPKATGPVPADEMNPGALPSDVGQGPDIKSMSKNVIPTLDGRILVLSPSKIIEYDRDLNIINEVDLKTDKRAGPR